MEQGLALTGSRRLLRRLRDIMAGSGSAQQRLDKIVQVIAADMVAEVCSAYVLRAGEVLELFATEGLRREVAQLKAQLGQRIPAGSSPSTDGAEHPTRKTEA